NCPPYSEKYGGLDILSSLRMPSGVAPLTVLEPEQAALAAAKILGFKEKIAAYQKKIREKIIEEDKKLTKQE
ncbi:AIR carboxylase family protein, partial [Candidatus Gottesmanbacteria bacterium]|nr:AIR carboxylase family protein [Candidatus Gottesmanbacteria bacterium]